LGPPGVAVPGAAEPPVDRAHRASRFGAGRPPVGGAGAGGPRAARPSDAAGRAGVLTGDADGSGCAVHRTGGAAATSTAGRDVGQAAYGDTVGAAPDHGDGDPGSPA